MRPINAFRQKSYTRDAANGLVQATIDAAGLDSEMNLVFTELSQLRSTLIGVTNADGSLTNIGSATAMSLAGAELFTATGGQTAFDTTIPWQSAFVAITVPVYVNGVQLNPGGVTVANDGSGNLLVTIAPQNAGNLVVIQAFSGTGGLQTALAEFATPGAGTDLIGVYDPGGLYPGASTLTAALQQVAGALATLTTGVGSTAGLIRSNGTVAMAADWSMGGFVINNLAPGVLSTDAVTVGQLASFTAVWNALQSYFLKLDGSTTMAGSLNFGTNKGINLATGTASTDAVNVGQLAGYLDVAGVNPATANLNIGGFRVTNMADGVANTDAVTLEQLNAVSSAASGFVNVNDYTTAGTFNLVLPAGVTKVKIRAWGAGGGGGATDGFNGGNGGGAGGFVETYQTVVANSTLSIVVGAGGASQSAGTNSSVTVVASSTVLATANGGGAATGGIGGTVGAGGSGSFAGANGTAFLGANGDGPDHTASYHGGDGGSATQGGQGGYGGTNNFAPIAGFAPGGGGGGAGGGASGALGAAGRVTVYY